MEWDFSKFGIEVPENLFPPISQYLNPMCVVLEKIALSSSRRAGYDNILFFSEIPGDNAIIFKGECEECDNEHIAFTEENEAIKVTISTFEPIQRKIYTIDEVMKWYDDYMQSEIDKGKNDPNVPKIEEGTNIKDLLLKKLASLLGQPSPNFDRAKPEDARGELNIPKDGDNPPTNVELRPLKPDDPKFDPDDPTRFPLF